jgi:hypothetical protein
MQTLGTRGTVQSETHLIPSKGDNIMSLNYDLTRVQNRDKDTDKGWNITQSIIFATMSVGIGEITEENVHEFWMRYSIFAANPYFTVEDVRNHIGLKTNVSTITRHKFLTVMVPRFMENNLRGHLYNENYKKEQAAAAAKEEEDQS